MQRLFAQIATVVPTLHGWCVIEKANRLAAAVVALKPEVIVEIGIYGGSSFIPLALAAEYNKKGRVVGIDPWSSEASTEGLDGENLKWWSNLDHDSIYRAFIGQVLALGLKDRVKILPTRSDAVNIDADIGPTIDLLHIDGAHHVKAAMFDAQNYGLRVRVGGLCFVDDLEWSGGGPKKAAELLEKSGFTEIWRAGTGVMYQRTGKPAVALNGKAKPVKPEAEAAAKRLKRLPELLARSKRQQLQAAARQRLK